IANSFCSCTPSHAILRKNQKYSSYDRRMPAGVCMSADFLYPARISIAPGLRNNPLSTRGPQRSLIPAIRHHRSRSSRWRVLHRSQTRLHSGPDYPKDLIRILVVSDESTDQTDAIVLSYGSEVTLIRIPRGGKSAALNLALQHSRGEIL